MKIRLETPADYREVENLTREAFWNVYRPGCVEHFVLKKYRDNPDFVPELDFVMEHDGRIIGHVMYSRAEIIGDDGNVIPAWTFGPISIHPDYKRKGYGLRLLKFSIEKAKALGVGILCMEGNIDFYKHAGFVLASGLGIHYHGEPKDSDVPYFLAQELLPGYLDSREGTYHTPKGYFVADENPQEFEAYDAGFPQKEKLVLPGQLGVPTMSNDRIYLRRWQDFDAEALFKYASDPEVGPRAGWTPHKSIEESREIISTVFNNATTWAIVDKVTDEAIGAMGYMISYGCKLPCRADEPLVGYWVAKPFWNKGICTDALNLMLEYIRSTEGFVSLISSHFVDNPASGRVLEKCGFLPTGDEVFDDTLYGGADRPVRVLRLWL